MSNLTALNRLGPYRLLTLLGVGGMAEVYRAHDPRLDREVAIKVLPAALAQQPGFLERFRREARVVARLDHPNILPIYDVGEENGVMYVVMPLVEGGTLRDRLVERGTCSLREVVTLISQVALALHEAHQNGLVHRDVKPANILLAPGERALLADFGIACALADGREVGITQAGMGIGTAEYMSPEQASGEPVDHRADVYALGIVLFQALTGRVPFSATDHFTTAYMQVHQAPPAPRSLNPAIPPAVEALILKALAKDPAERLQSAAQFAEALAGATLAPHLPGQPGLASHAQGGEFQQGSEPASTYYSIPAMGPIVRLASRADAASWSAWPGAAGSDSRTELAPLSGAATTGHQVRRSRTGRRWAVLVGLVLAVALVAGAAAVGRMRAQQFALSSSAPAPGAPGAPPPATATPASPVYYMAHFFELNQGDLQQGDQLGEQMSISNDQYQALEGAHGTLYRSGAADRFGRAFGTGIAVRDGDGALRFVVLVDRFGTPAQARQYYEYASSLLSQTTAVSIGQQALAGLARSNGNQAVYRLILQDQNVVATLATVPTRTPLVFQNYFGRLAQIIDQRGHRCQYASDLKPVPGSPAMCAGQ